ncbi:universal stress protein [Psychrobacter sp.]|uniref:universal stress protein n=1 Tax=Psychrobacter sp. TaxID=56811 RepID=UPI0025ED77F5|nr:universal stress protein [Psychrobacter sp.]
MNQYNDKVIKENNDSKSLNSQSLNETILACIDGSNVTQSVCDYAAWYANELNLSVSLLHVIDVPKSYRHNLSGAIGMDSRRSLMTELSLMDEQTARIANKHGEALLQDAKAHILTSLPQANVYSYLRRSKLLPAIEHHASKSRVIVIGRRGKDHQNDYVNIGSQIENVVRAINRPILVCSDGFITPDSFMVAFDGSETAKKAVHMICKNNIAKNLEGHIVMVDNIDTANETELYKAQKKMSDAGFNITAHIIDTKKTGNGDIVSALTTFRNDNDISMFVIGAYGHSKWRRFFVGSTTTKLLTKTTAPVILLR